MSSCATSHRAVIYCTRSNFFSLTDEDGEVHYYVMMGAEGGNTTFYPRASSGLWNEGTVTRRENGSARFTPVAGGAIDSGLLYAVTSFDDTKNNRRVQWGWANEESNNFGLTQQGFQGCFGLPREMYVMKTKGLINVNGSLTSLGNTRVVEQSDGTFTGYTLAARPLPEVVSGIRNGTTQRNIATNGTSTSSSMAGTGSSHMELMATFRNLTGSAGLTVAASPGGEEYTTISFDPANYTINVDRSHSSTIGEFANYTVVGYFYPYTFAQTGTEDVEMHVYVDGSLLELYVNVSISNRLRIRSILMQLGPLLAHNAHLSISNRQHRLRHLRRRRCKRRSLWPHRLDRPREHLPRQAVELKQPARIRHVRTD